MAARYGAVVESASIELSVEGNMGASTWTYFVPYQPEVEQALTQLQQEVFRNGQYQDEDTPFDHQAATTFQSHLSQVMMDPVQRQQYEAVLQSMQPQQRLAWQRAQELLAAAAHRTKHSTREIPKTIDELRRCRGAAGTHSILDIRHIAETPKPGAVAALPPVRLVELFGTVKPTRQQIEAVFNRVEWPELQNGWVGVFIVAYADDKPAEIFFAGTTGD